MSEIPTVANGDVSKDGLLLRYKLRHNIKWQDGQPLTCNDLKFTWQVVMNPKNNVITTDGYKDIASIDCSNQEHLLSWKRNADAFNSHKEKDRPVSIGRQKMLKICESHMEHVKRILTL